ncbi:hypothetical protein [Pseudoblastomonas halimionae]|uniref:Uncharacterized protein n=1 Tax=Alteriqipengyuania halimionae TaxID=1926630 RepID=A0A6I4U4G9_9SPHN|nr:hypothetical protein [Alteriqipengyuania halimionae]MXP09825.1 hypothetical protein [Alteriqipengyuania halimionae]
MSAPGSQAATSGVVENSPAAVVGSIAAPVGVGVGAGEGDGLGLGEGEGEGEGGGTAPVSGGGAEGLLSPPHAVRPSANAMASADAAHALYVDPSLMRGTMASRK